MYCPLSERRLLSLPLCPGTLDGGLSACKSPRPAKPHITPEPHRQRLLNWTSDAACKQRKLCSLRPITTTLYTISIFVINSCANCVLWCWEKYIYFTLLYFYSMTWMSVYCMGRLLMYWMTWVYSEGGDEVVAWVVVVRTGIPAPPIYQPCRKIIVAETRHKSRH
jgi:hypothetical protein